ncbi:helix-turn-helix domain-containing protein [Solihabitans fulvus]|nr:helix-turn-helix transcriptional regulator [Solihabitans fulvus]
MMRTLRESADKTGYDAAERLQCSQAKISRMETGDVGVKLAELEALLGYYLATDEQRTRALTVWKESRHKSSWSRFADALTERFRAYAELESDAALIQRVDISLVPGFFQTENYALALHKAAPHFPSQINIDRAIEARKKRQRRLDDDDPPKVHAIIDEAVLHRLVGGPEIMVEQLQHLHDLSRRRNITIQVLPFGAGAYATLGGPFIMLVFADPEDPTAVYREHLGGGSWVEDPAEVDQYTRTFDDLRKAALSAKESANLIREVAADLDPR